MKAQSWSFLRCLFSSENSRKATLNNIIHVLKSVVNTVSKYANLATELGRQLTKGKRAKGLNTTSGAQFVALLLVKPVV